MLTVKDLDWMNAEDVPTRRRQNLNVRSSFRVSVGRNGYTRQLVTQVVYAAGRTRALVLARETGCCQR